jgi:hypothetical protein
MTTRLLRAIAILVGLTPTMLSGAPDPGPAGSKTFQAWTATCNNIGACVVIGSAEADLFYVRIARDAGATASPEIKIVLAVEEPFKAAGRQFMLKAVAKGPSDPLDPVETTITSGDTNKATALLAGDASLRLIAAIRDADRLAYRFGGISGSLDLKGLSAALRWMDARQGRAGTPTALVAKGMTPIGQVPGPRLSPVIVAAPARSASVIAKPIVSAALLTLAKPACDSDTVAAHDGVEGWRLGPNLVLVSVP